MLECARLNQKDDVQSLGIPEVAIYSTWNINITSWNMI
jgi:hypothetical protein